MSDNPTGTGTQATDPSSEGLSALEAFGLFLDQDESDTQDEAEANQDDEESELEIDASDDDEESESEDTASEEEDEPAEQLYTVKIDGKEEQVSLDELRNGYQRNADYTRKTMEAANQRKAAEAELESARAERAEYASLLPKLRATFEAGLGPEPDWATLRDQDPVRATLLWQQREEHRRQLDQIKAEEQRVAAQQAEDQRKLDERRSVEERTALLGKIPEWKDDKVATAESAAIRQLMAEVGFEPNEQVLSDHRLVVIARKAMKFDAMLAKSKTLQKQKSKAPVVPPGGGVRPTKGSVDKAHEQLKRSGRVKDAANLFANLI